MPTATQSHSVATATESTCGQCGYCIRGISGTTCPECGSDLRVVGIRPPNQPTQKQFVALLLIWTLVMPTLAVLFTSVLVEFVLPYRQMTIFNRAIFFQAPYLNATVWVTGTEQTWRWHRPPLHALPPAEVHLDARNNGPVLDVNLVTGSFTYEKPDHTKVNQPNGFSAKVLADWFAVSGVNAADPHVQKICDQAYLALMEGPAGTSNRFTQFNDINGTYVGIAHPGPTFSFSTGPGLVIYGTITALWLGLWIAGVRWIYRRSNRSLTLMTG